MQAHTIALKRPEEASSDEMVRDWSVVAATIARRSGRRSSMLDALFGFEQADLITNTAQRRIVDRASGRGRLFGPPFFIWTVGQ